MKQKRPPENVDLVRPEEVRSTSDLKALVQKSSPVLEGGEPQHGPAEVPVWTENAATENGGRPYEVKYGRWGEIILKATDGSWVKVISLRHETTPAGQWGQTGQGGGGAGGGGKGRAPRQGGDGKVRPLPHLPAGCTDPIQVMGKRLQAAFSFGQQKFEGKDVIGGGSGGKKSKK